MPASTAITLLEEAVLAASGNGDAVDLGTSKRPLLKAALSVSLVGGTDPSMAVEVQTSADGDAWRTLGAFDAVTEEGELVSWFGDADRYIRAKWTLDGNAPVFTAEITGTAYQSFAGLEDLAENSIPAAALADVALVTKARALLRATDEAVSALQSGGFTPPITAWGSDTTGAVCDLAAYYALKQRGFNPEGSDSLILDAADKAKAWLKMVAAEEIEPAGIVDSTPDEYDGGAFVVSRAPRGW